MNSLRIFFCFTMPMLIFVVALAGYLGWLDLTVHNDHRPLTLLGCGLIVLIAAFWSIRKPLHDALKWRNHD